MLVKPTLKIVTKKVMKFEDAKNCWFCEHPLFEEEKLEEGAVDEVRIHCRVTNKKNGAAHSFSNFRAN